MMVCQIVKEAMVEGKEGNDRNVVGEKFSDLSGALCFGVLLFLL